MTTAARRGLAWLLRRRLHQPAAVNDGDAVGNNGRVREEQPADTASTDVAAQLIVSPRLMRTTPAP